MKKIALNKKFVNYCVVLFVYFTVSFLLFFKIFLTTGSIVGSDWGFPDNLSQLKVYIQSLSHSWTHTGNFFGTRQLSATSIIVIYPVYLFALIGVPIALSIKLFLISVFALGAANMNLFLRYIKLKPLTSLIGGLIFILSPVFFNYSLIGWIYVLLSLALLPLFVYLVLLAINHKNYHYILLASLIFSIATIQSQTVVWYSLVFLAVIFGHGLDKKDFWLAVRYFFLLIFVFLLLNFYWLPALFLFPDQGTVSGDMVKSTISLGTSLRLSTYNLLRTWGSLYNYQFENSYPKALEFLSFLIPIIGFSSLFFYKKFKSHLGYLILIFLIPAIFYFADRQLLSGLPFSNVIRDIARFSVLSTFALIVMVAIALNQIVLSEKKYKRWLFPLFLLLFLLNSFPFWSGGLFSQPLSGFDFRMRTKVWPTEYQALNDKLSKEDLNQRAIFLPLGGLVSLSDDLRYKGAFHEIPDVYSGFSPIPATVSFSDRSQGASAGIIGEIDQSIKAQDIDKFEHLFKIAKINYVVFRRDIDYYDWSSGQKNEFENMLKNIVAKQRASVFFESDKIYAIKLNNQNQIITSSDKIVEITSNSNNILVKYLDSKIISSLNFEQFVSFFDTASVFPGEKIFSVSEKPTPKLTTEFDSKGYQFISLGKIAEKLSLLKWSLCQQNLNLKLDRGIKKENLETISAIEEISLSNFRDDGYIVFLDKEIANGTIYLKSNTTETIRGKINGAEIIFKPESESFFKADIPRIPTGLNILQIFDSEANPILLKAVTSSQSVTTAPNISSQKIDDSKYQVNINGINSDFYLDFAENYNSLWQVRQSDNLFAKSIIPASRHFVSNGFGNGYKIAFSDLQNLGVLTKNNSGSYDCQLFLVFAADDMTLFGITVSSISIFLLFVMVALFIKREYEK